jgi:hypothetical protein
MEYADRKLATLYRISHAARAPPTLLGIFLDTR